MMKRKGSLSVISCAVAVMYCCVLAETVQAVKPPSRDDKQIDLLQRDVTAKAANADLELLQKIMVQMHPGLDIYGTQKQFAALIEQSRVTAGDTIKLREFFMRCARITDLVRCGHTYASVPLACQMKLQYGTKMFPVPLLFIGEKAYVNHHQARIPCGAEVLSINNMAQKGLFGHFCPFCPFCPYLPLVLCASVVTSSWLFSSCDQIKSSGSTKIISENRCSYTRPSIAYRGPQNDLR